MKKRIIILIFFAVSISVKASQIESYDMDVWYEIQQKRLNIIAVLNFREIDEKKVILLFNSNCIISSVTFSNDIKVSYSRQGKDTLILNLDSTISETGGVLIKFTYSYPLDEDTVVIIDRGHRWYPMIAENTATFIMNIWLPEKFTAVSAGKAVHIHNKNDNQFTYSTSVPVFKIPLIIAPENYYKINELSCGTTKTMVYYLQARDDKSIDSIQTDVCNLLTYFSENFGKYPFGSFTIVETPVFDGTNLGSSIVCTGSSNIRAFSEGYKDWLKLAVASQWFGAGVFPKLFSKGFWFLSISLPHYLKMMYIKNSEGEQIFNRQLNELSDKYNEIADTGFDVPLLDIDFPNTKEKGILLYCKGVLILDEIRKLMGEPVWTKMLKDFHENNYGKVILLDNLLKYIDKYDPSSKCSAKLNFLLGSKGKFK